MECDNKRVGEEIGFFMDWDVETMREHCKEYPNMSCALKARLLHGAMVFEKEQKRKKRQREENKKPAREGQVYDIKEDD
jgi:hypothetical protein